MKIVKIHYNWFYTIGDECGEGYEVAEVGKGECVKIEEHQCGVEGDRWYYDIHHTNGQIIRTFNPNQIFIEYVHVQGAI